MVFTRFLLFFLLFEAEFTEIHDSAYRRFGVGRYFHQIHIGGISRFQRFVNRDDAALFTFRINEADFAVSNLFVDAGFLLLSYC